MAYQIEYEPDDDRSQASPLERAVDLETLSVALDPRFQSMIAHARGQAARGLGIPAEEVRRRLGITDEERVDARRRMEEEEKGVRDDEVDGR